MVRDQAGSLTTSDACRLGGPLRELRVAPFVLHWRFHARQLEGTQPLLCARNHHLGSPNLPVQRDLYRSQGAALRREEGLC